MAATFSSAIRCWACPVPQTPYFFCLQTSLVCTPGLVLLICKEGPSVEAHMQDQDTVESQLANQRSFPSKFQSQRKKGGPAFRWTSYLLPGKMVCFCSNWNSLWSAPPSTKGSWSPIICPSYPPFWQLVISSFFPLSQQYSYLSCDPLFLLWSFPGKGFRRLFFSCFHLYISSSPREQDPSKLAK